MKVYKPAERPDVEVQVDGVWCAGELRAWKQVGDEWRAEVQYRLPGEHSSYIGEFGAGDVREDTVDRSRGRRGAERGAASQPTATTQTSPLKAKRASDLHKQ